MQRQLSFANQFRVTNYRMAWASAFISLFIATSAVVSEGHASALNTYADGRGNLIVESPDGGAKIIRVGAAQGRVNGRGPTDTGSSRARPSVITAPRASSILIIVPVANTSCSSAVVLHGRSFMYGLDRGQTPVFDHPNC